MITDLPISGATLRAQIPIPVSPKARELLGFAYRGDLNRFDLYLYEVDGVNLGQFSPTESWQRTPTKLWDTSPMARQHSTAQSSSASSCKDR